jgi:prolyl-tRNA editing enzyme YbaK/EbsC (Cys-tRNA(Pro) deacylase)
MRLCPEAVSDELTGFEHNAVSPIGIRTRLPIVLSHSVAALRPDLFWLGAGEVDLKVGLSAADFQRAYAPHVVDCTYADAEAES